MNVFLTWPFTRRSTCLFRWRDSCRRSWRGLRAIECRGHTTLAKGAGPYGIGKGVGLGQLVKAGRRELHGTGHYAQLARLGARRVSVHHYMSAHTRAVSSKRAVPAQPRFDTAEQCARVRVRVRARAATHPRGRLVAGGRGARIETLLRPTVSHLIDEQPTPNDEDQLTKCEEWERVEREREKACARACACVCV